jgi:predicted nucleotidyltransferase
MKEEMVVDGTSVNLLSVEHLILMKQYANRKQDIDDVILLSEFLKN